MRTHERIQIEIDPEVEAVYIRLSGNKVAATRPLETDVLVDVDARGRPVGLEFLDTGRIRSGLRKFHKRFHHAPLSRVRVQALQHLFAG